MKPTITFETMDVRMGALGTESPVPDLIGGLILQNQLEFYLDEEDEIYEGGVRQMPDFLPLPAVFLLFQGTERDEDKDSGSGK